MGRKTKARKSVNKENETQPNIVQQKAKRLDSKSCEAVETDARAQIQAVQQEVPVQSQKVQPAVVEREEIEETVPEALVQWAVQEVLMNVLGKMVLSEPQPELDECTTAADELVQRSLLSAVLQHAEREAPLLPREPEVSKGQMLVPHVPLADLSRAASTDAETVLQESLLSSPAEPQSALSRISQCLSGFRRCW